MDSIYIAQQPLPQDHKKIGWWPKDGSFQNKLSESSYEWFLTHSFLTEIFVGIIYIYMLLIDRTIAIDYFCI